MSWIQTSNQSWKHKNKLITILMPRYEINNKEKGTFYLYAIEVIGDFGWASQYYIERHGLTDKKNAVRIVNSLKKKYGNNQVSVKSYNRVVK
jgi:hypothetical protein